MDQELWHVPDLMVKLKYHLYFWPIHSLLHKNYHKQYKTQFFEKDQKESKELGAKSFNEIASYKFLYQCYKLQTSS